MCQYPLVETERTNEPERQRESRSVKRKICQYSHPQPGLDLQMDWATQMDNMEPLGEEAVSTLGYLMWTTTNTFVNQVTVGPLTDQYFELKSVIRLCFEVCHRRTYRLMKTKSKCPNNSHLNMPSQP